ncbi:MAG: carboxymuconolactone decarboxylase family protein [Segniliparus sp.]|uniref:carboxymuconolactone decarboxylase family protein n=1 Tax=Segniliparus sp. TaxID=2804064 RepID=UPI003F3818B3
MATPSQPRIAPGGFWKIGPLAWVIDQGGRRRLKISQFRVISTLGRNIRLFPFFIGYTGYFQGLSSIKLRNVELVILRVANLRGSAYELNHHIRMSARAGITDEERARVAQGPSAPGWSPKEKALLTAVDGFVKDKAIGDTDWAELSKHFTEAQTLEILLLTGAYDSLATTIDIVGIKTEYTD